MAEFLSKEDIRKWRSSLERITLEEYATRLGKVIQSEQHDDSLVDNVMLRSLNSMTDDTYIVRTEKIHSFAIKSFNKEKEIKEKKQTKVLENKTVETKKEVKISSKPKEIERTEKEVKVVETTSEIKFNKTLTAREQLVFDHFFANKNTIVYAKDLAKILNLPRDYVYKYIKNLRSKLTQDILQNADNGGYLLKV